MMAPVIFDSFTNYLPIIIGAGALVLFTLVFVLTYKLTRKKLSKKQPDNFNILLEALGGKGNIISVTNSRSRITLKLQDSSLINREKLTEAGVVSVISMSEKISLVFNEDASKTAQKFQNLL